MYRRHVWILVFRVLLLTAAFCLFFIDEEKPDFTSIKMQGFSGPFHIIIWLSLAFGMLFRLFPNRRIALGARKHYACSGGMAPVEKIDSESMRKARKSLHKGAFLCGGAWVLFNCAIFFVLFRLGLLIPAVSMLIMLAYAVFDIVCILFFCPFQLFFLRKRCCVTCRIYNWDYLMMCTPMVLFPSVFSMSLLLLSVAVVIRWEIALRRNPQYFMEETNENLRCDRCEDRLCRTQITSKKS